MTQEMTQDILSKGKSGTKGSFFSFCVYFWQQK